MAVLELSRPVSMKAHIQPLCLGEEELGPGLEARVAGWGATHPTLLTRPKVLQTTEVVTVDNKLCEQWHWYEIEQSAIMRTDSCFQECRDQCPNPPGPGVRWSRGWGAGRVSGGLRGAADGPGPGHRALAPGRCGQCGLQLRQAWSARDIPQVRPDRR